MSSGPTKPSRQTPDGRRCECSPSTHSLRSNGHSKRRHAIPVLAASCTWEGLVWTCVRLATDPQLLDNGESLDKVGRMPALRLVVISLRYSSWSMRPWLVLAHAGASFETETVELELGRQSLGTGQDAALAKVDRSELAERRRRGSVAGLFPVLHVDGAPIHESLAICEYVNEAFPGAQLWPDAVLARARARAISSEMATSFANLRTNMSCHLFGRVAGYAPNAATQRDIDRVFELWREALERSGGPFLFGRFSIADAMFFPVRTRLRTYGIAVPVDLAAYVHAIDELPAVRALHELARSAPAIPAYDAYLRGLGGDPNAAL